MDVLEHIRYNDRLEYRAQYAESLIEKTKNFKEFREGFQDETLLEKHADLIRLLLADIFPTGLTLNEIKATSVPITNITFNYTERFKNILNEAGRDFSMEFRQVDDDEFYIFCCCLILQAYFKKDIRTSLPFYYDIPDKNGIIKHYKITINSDFTEIFPTENAEIPSDEIVNYLMDNMDDVKMWKKYFPPESWYLKGFTIITLVDSTVEIALSELKSNIIEITPGNPMPNNLNEIFKSLFDIPQVNFGFMLYDEKHHNLQKLDFYNNVFTTPILDFWFSLFNKKLRSEAISNISYNPKPIIVSDIINLDEEIKKIPSYQSLEEHNIRSFMIIPIVKDGKFLAALEFTSSIPNSFNGLKLKKIEPFLDVILFPIDRFNFEKNNQIEAIIQREYTSIHESVVWKFRNEAEKYFNAMISNKMYTLKEISFKKLIPLFGQTDIRSSSEKRIKYMLEDLNHQLLSLQNIFDEIPNGSEKMKNKILRLKDSLNNDLKGDTERKIQKYLKNNIHPALREIQEETLSEKLKHDIHHYFGKISPKSELFYIQRNKLDESITLINRKIADILDEKQTLAQHIFPHFYERFKSDGVEHNLFLGQSISPNQKYSGEIIKQLRFWQLETMCLVEHQLEKFKSNLPIHLDLAPLIFVYNEKVNIRFRMDEKRFDVDGAYNSYYEIIKKRLDKALVKNSTERLTTPGKMTIVYLEKEHEKEYLGYIAKLQEKNLLKNDVEFLEVQDLQGVTGLFALRVSLFFNN